MNKSKHMHKFVLVGSPFRKPQLWRCTSCPAERSAPPLHGGLFGR